MEWGWSGDGVGMDGWMDVRLGSRGAHEVVVVQVVALLLCLAGVVRGEEL
jgi:hypothetical protein